MHTNNSLCSNRVCPGNPNMYPCPICLPPPVMVPYCCPQCPYNNKGAYGNQTDMSNNNQKNMVTTPTCCGQ